MKHLNHRGSAFLLALTVALAALMLLSALGIKGDWKPKTTPFRLVNDPFAGWSLLIVLCMGQVIIRLSDELTQCVSALVFGGVILGLRMTTSLFWDPFLSCYLGYGAVPMLYSASQMLKSLTALRGGATKSLKRQATRQAG